MPNNFDDDSHCKAVWNVDNGALTTDSKGTNTLTNSGMGYDTSNYKQGDASADADSVNDYLYITDANLDAGFPLKNGDSNKKISICGWFRVSAFPSSGYRHICGKYAVAANGRSIGLWCHKNTNWNFEMGIGYNSGNSVEAIPHASTIATGIWYHFGVTFDNATKAYRIRIWDDTAGAILGSDATGTATNNIYVGSMAWYIGSLGSAFSCLGGEKDEIVVFDKVLDTDEIDAIRAGTYSGAGAGGESTDGAALFLGMNF